jgi:hypothetical protein
VERTKQQTKNYSHREVIGVAARAKKDGSGELILDVDELANVSPSAAQVDVEEVADMLHGALHDVFRTVIDQRVLDSFEPIPQQAEA